MEMSGGRVVVIGVGHRDRGDDGIGPAIVDEVAAREIGVRTVVREGDLADLLTEWGPDDAVVIVDALRSDRPAGEIVELDPGDLGGSAGASTHGVGVAFGVEGGPTWTHRNGYFLALRGRYARSQRSTAYDSGGAWLSIGRDL